MQSVALCGKRLPDSVRGQKVSVEIAGQSLDFALVLTPQLSFEPESPSFRNKALIRIDAFSCNYRDKSLLLTFGKLCKDESFLCFGSEFCGQVVEVGADVRDFQVGDRVMANGSYPDSGVKGVKGGLPTNHASKRYLSIPEARLIKVPDQMPNEVAASFQVGAQTSYSMVRKLALQPGANVLVTAARSNTSLFVLQALACHGIDAYALSGSAEALPWPPLKRLVVTPRGGKLVENEELVALCKQLGGFDAAVDPFYDLFAAQVLPFLRSGGSYITCGCYRQAEEFSSDQAENNALRNVLGMAMINNNTIIGNCIGQTSDLERAIQDYVHGRLQVTIDRVYRGDDFGAFLDRTYNQPERFGKVVYAYD